MKSYACIDRIEGNFAVCEVELVSVEDSSLFDVFEKETEMVDIPITEISKVVEDVKESDILVVEYDGCDVKAIYGKDEEEKLRRVDRIIAIMNEN